jgi:general stress protein 26
MPTPAEIETSFWAALKSDRTLMLGLDGVADGYAQPMTAILEPGATEDHYRGPIWFFTTKTNTLVDELAQGHRAAAHFASKGHNIFAAIHGDLSVSNDRAAIDRLWNAHVAAWFEGGKDDPKLALLRLDPERANLWIDGSSLIAGVKVMLGVDPKTDYRDKVADVDLRA